MPISFTDLLTLPVRCPIVASHQSALCVLGDPHDTAQVIDALCARPGLSLAQPDGGVFFGFPILTAPFPILVNSLMTEHNTHFEKLSLFSWVEENAIAEPRAEVFGLTPLGEQPVLFLRDLDLDRPVEAYIQTAQPAGWLRVSGVAIVDPGYGGDLQTLSPDAGAIAALRRQAPADAQPFVEGLAFDLARGTPLRPALRSRRKSTDNALMHLCDGWRVLSQAATIVRVSPSGMTNFAESMRLEPPRKW